MEGVESSRLRGEGDIERALIEKIMSTRFDDLPEEAIEIEKALVLTILGTALAGAGSEGCEALVEQAREWGGRKEATILSYGGQVPAHNAVLVNAFMARALDFCDGMVPGLHLGATCVTSALAVSELIGGCSGRDFLAYLFAGTETVARINACSTYKGNAFKPTGVAGILGVAALASRMLRLTPNQTLHALALAFNRSGGSFQSNVDGALSVRAVMGFASQGGIICAQLAQKGITGPENFLKGQFGYFYLFGDDTCSTETLIGDWEKRLAIKRIQFKRYPTCWNNTSSIDATLKLAEEKGLTPDNIDRIEVTITPHQYRLVGHPFEAGDNLRVNAQFSVRYSVAAALTRKALRLEHFDEPALSDPGIMALIDRVDVIADPDLQEKGRNAAVVRVRTKDGVMHEETVLAPRGRPEIPLTREDHVERFNQCFDYAGMPRESAEKILTMVMHLEDLPDVRALIPYNELRKWMGQNSVDAIMVFGDTGDWGLRYGHLRYLTNGKVIFGNSVLNFFRPLWTRGQPHALFSNRRARGRTIHSKGGYPPLRDYPPVRRVLDTAGSHGNHR